MVGGQAQIYQLHDAFADEEFEKDGNGCPTGNLYVKTNPTHRTTKLRPLLLFKGT